VRLVGCAAEFDAFAEGGVRGDAIEMQQLEGPEAKGNSYRLSEALFGTLEKSADSGVKRDLPAEDAHDERGGEVAVFGRQASDVRGMKKIVAVAFVLPDEGKNLEGGASSGRNGFGRRLRRELWRGFG
jgi:hypothetical protein